MLKPSFFLMMMNMILRYCFTFLFLIGVFTYTQAKNVEGDTIIKQTSVKFTFSKPKAAKDLPDSIRKTIVSKNKPVASMPMPVSRTANAAMSKRKAHIADSLAAVKKIEAQIQKDFPALPKFATFCGERVPMENLEVAKRFNQEFSRYLAAKGLISHFLRISNRYKGEIRNALKRNGLHADLFYLPAAESGFANLTSSAGAKGFFQFMEQTAKDYGLEVSYTVDERLHPQKAADAACRYLRNLYAHTGRWSLAAAAYNMGAGALQTNLASQGPKDYYHLNLNPETDAYVYRILSIKILMENAGGYGIGVGGKYSPIPHQVQKVNFHIEDLHEFAEECQVDYKTLKILNPWMVGDRLDATPGKTYEIWLPAKSSQKVEADELIPLPFVVGGEGRSYLRDSIKNVLDTAKSPYHAEEDIFNWYQNIIAAESLNR